MNGGGFMSGENLSQILKNRQVLKRGHSWWGAVGGTACQGEKIHAC